MISGPSMAAGAPAISLNGSSPRCEHLDGLSGVSPQSEGCPACPAGGDHPATLLVCLTCGWVACGNDSRSQHAKAHYEETDHPLARGLPPGSRRIWCYVHQRFV